MYFDYLIVLVVALAGGLFVLAKRPVEPSTAQAGEGEIAPVLIGAVFTAGFALLIPWALVLRDCLHNTGPAQSRGIGAFALLEGGLFVAILYLGIAYARKSD